MPIRSWRLLALAFVRALAAGQVAMALCALAAYPACAKQVVFLKSGFSLEIDSFSQERGTVVLQTGGGTLEFQTSQIARIEVLPDAPAPPPARTPLDHQEPELVLNAAADNQGIDADFLRSVAQVESGMRQTAISRKGAVGLLQLMPATAAELRVDPTLATENAQGGAIYLRDLLIRYRGNSALALAAYNAGPGAVARFGGVPPYEETRRYVRLVLQEYGRRVHARNLARPSSLQSPSPQTGARGVTSADGGE